MHYASNKKGNKSHGKIEIIVQVNQKQQSSIIVYSVYRLKLNNPPNDQHIQNKVE